MTTKTNNKKISFEEADKAAHDLVNKYGSPNPQLGILGIGVQPHDEEGYAVVVLVDSKDNHPVLPKRFNNVAVFLKRRKLATPQK